MAKKRRHLVIPDTQCKPGNDLDHLRWAGEAVKDYRPDVVIHLGDHWDMPSLSSYDKPGSRSKEGSRYVDDIAAGNEGMDVLTKPFRNIKGYKPDMIFLTGNHEHRIERAIEDDPVHLEGVIGYDDFELYGFRRYEFLEVVFIDGIAYSHYFQGGAGRAIAGSIDNRLNKIGQSFVQGHQQGLQYGTRTLPTGKVYHGLVAGSMYTHDEDYMGRQGNSSHWRGIVVLNEVEDGDYDVMPLSMDYLRRKFGGGK